MRLTEIRSPPNPYSPEAVVLSIEEKQDNRTFTERSSSSTGTPLQRRQPLHQTVGGAASNYGRFDASVAQMGSDPDLKLTSRSAISVDVDYIRVARRHHQCCGGRVRAFPAQACLASQIVGEVGNFLGGRTGYKRWRSMPSSYRTAAL